MKSSRFSYFKIKVGGKEIKMADFKEREMLNVTAYVTGNVKTASFEWNGETVNVTNFSLVEEVDGKKHYTNCSAYGKWSEVAKDIKEGDYIHVYGYLKERETSNKTYRNFIVNHMNRADLKENKEDK